MNRNEFKDFPCAVFDEIKHSLMYSNPRTQNQMLLHVLSKLQLVPMVFARRQQPRRERGEDLDFGVLA